MTMVQVSKQDWSAIKRFVQGAANYLGGGSVQHAIDCFEVHYLERYGSRTMVLQCYEDDDGDMVYRADTAILTTYRKQNSYMI